jgi:hypothetical protein
VNSLRDGRSNACRFHQKLGHPVDERDGFAFKRENAPAFRAWAFSSGIAPP